VTVRISRGAVTGLEPAFTVERLAGALEVPGRDPRRLDPEVADRYAIVGQRPLRVVDDAQLCVEAGATSGLHALGELLLRRQVERARMPARGRAANSFGQSR